MAAGSNAIATITGMGTMPNPISHHRSDHFSWRLSNMQSTLSMNRRTFVMTAVAGLASGGVGQQSQASRPVVSESACPLEVITPVASDGYKGQAVLRKPPGRGPFPAFITIHGGITTVPLTRLQSIARDLANPSRFLAAGYVVVAPTYRSRDVDLQSPVSLEDSLAVVDYVRKLPYVDAKSIVVYGCSGGGDLALEIAARTRICAVVAEEPASLVMSGIFNNSIPKRGERYTPEDGLPILQNPKKYYTPEFQKVLRAKIAKMECPILIIQGDVDRQDEMPINRFNAEVLIPELRAAKKTIEVRTYHEQAHCFCAASGLPRSSGAVAPASWPGTALKASRDADTFCRRHLVTQPKAIDSHLVTYVDIRQV